MTPKTSTAMSGRPMASTNSADRLLIQPGKRCEVMGFCEVGINKNYTHLMPQTLQIDTLNIHYPVGAKAFPATAKTGHPQREDGHAVKHLSLDLAAGDIACLLGPSGCGKSSLLRAIAGFVVPSTGRITLNQRVLSDATTFVAPESRGIGMVFQDYALFPHLTVLDNVLFGLASGRPKQANAEQTCRAQAMLDLVGLAGFEALPPRTLGRSGPTRGPGPRTGAVSRIDPVR